MAEELRQQVPVMKEVLRAMKIKIVEQEGLEADDLLGTIAGIGERAGMEVTILSGTIYSACYRACQNTDSEDKAGENRD